LGVRPPTVTIDIGPSSWTIHALAATGQVARRRRSLRQVPVAQSARQALPGRLALGRQGVAGDLLVVAGKDAPVGKGGVGPEDEAGVAEAAAEVARRVEEVGLVDLLVPLRAEPGDDQVALLVEQEPAFALGNEEGVGPANRLAAGPRR